MAGGGGNKKKFQYCTDPSGQEILYLRALPGHKLLTHVPCCVLTPSDGVEVREGPGILHDFVFRRLHGHREYDW